MAEYRVQVTRAAFKELESLPPDQGRRVLTAIESLIFDPRPKQSRKLAGSRVSYRVRVGDYRILYQVNERAKLVKVFAVGHRREVYR
ncbi:MAG: type II toxin-antitoxin system RelE/ParE family toxin [Chloroflexi bacterium]|nr:type II toxin-antitoxin system RelE/ParE family toxin [Chloroflexota bacterium]